jgi:hypothetical protein
LACRSRARALFQANLQKQKVQAYKQRLETSLNTQKELQRTNEKLEKQLTEQQESASQRIAQFKEGSLAQTMNFLFRITL